MRVAVTGASGFVGGAVCRHLRAAGIEVYGFGRRSRVPEEHLADASYRSWDIAAGPLPLPPPVDAVVHAAAWVCDHGDPLAAELVNVTGTAHVLRTWPRARFVQVSSAGVYHPYRPQYQATEDEAPDPDTVRWPGGYGRTKALAERLVAGMRPDAVVLRPHAVYGQGDRTLLPRVEAAVRRGRLPLPGSGLQRHALTRVGLLAEACLLGCRPGVPGGVYNVTDAEPVLLADALSRALAARGLPVRVLPMGRRPALALAAVAPAVLSRYAAHHLAVERTFDLTRSRELLGLRPTPTDLTDADTW